MRALNSALKTKLEELDSMIFADEGNKEGALSELKSLAARLAEVDERLGKMKGARKEYARTIQETDFALQKIDETAQTMSERFSKLSKVQIDL